MGFYRGLCRLAGAGPRRADRFLRGTQGDSSRDSRSFSPGSARRPRGLAEFRGRTDLWRLMSKPVIGLAGGIGSGKSAVGRLLVEFGAGLIESDRLGHEQLTTPEVVRTLSSWWGQEILDAEGLVDRSRVGRIVFADRAQRDRLEKLLHPRIGLRRGELKRQYQADPNITMIVIDAPLLYEAGIDTECDRVIFIEADKRIRVQRVLSVRCWSAQELDRREKMQSALDAKKRRADHIVTNNSSLDALRGQVTHLVTRILGIDPRS